MRCGLIAVLMYWLNISPSVETSGLKRKPRSYCVIAGALVTAARNIMSFCCATWLMPIDTAELIEPTITLTLSSLASRRAAATPSAGVKLSS